MVGHALSNALGQSIKVVFIKIISSVSLSRNLSFVSLSWCSLDYFTKNARLCCREKLSFFNVTISISLPLSQSPLICLSMPETFISEFFSFDFLINTKYFGHFCVNIKGSSNLPNKSPTLKISREFGWENWIFLGPSALFPISLLLLPPSKILWY